METSTRMEEELKCAACRRLFVNPVQLPVCWHHLCYSCAAARIQPASSVSGLQQLTSVGTGSPMVAMSGSRSRLATSVSCQRVDATFEPGVVVGGGLIIKSPSASSGSGSDASSDRDSDVVSVASETDSGVVVINGGGGALAGSGLRSGGAQSPFGAISTSMSSLSLQSDSGSVTSSLLPSNAAYVISCPVCSRLVPIDIGGVRKLPRPRAIEAIADRYREARSLPIDCQLCPTADIKPSTRVCEQCELCICDTCDHPEHRTIAGDLLETRRSIQTRQREEDTRCTEHQDELRSLYCLICRATICSVCQQQGRHVGHQTQPMGAMCRAQKTELSQLIHGLSEKARSGTEFIARLKSLQDRVETNCTDLESRLATECDALIAAIRWRQQQLVAALRRERAVKQQSYRDQVSQCTAKVHRTTGLLQLCVEVMKEADPTAFLQISSPLIKRVSHVDMNFVRDMEFEPRVSADFEMQLDRDPVQQAIHAMNFREMKVPNQPRILVRESSVLNNTITYVWEATAGVNSGANVAGFVLELDDGNGGEFREVFRGKETICTVEGLHFDTSYIARVRAINEAGQSPYSPPVCLRTAKVAWFSFDASSTSRDVLFSNENRTVTTSSFDDRVVLGSVGMTRGVHYWEVVVDRYENNKDPAFGIARLDVAKDKLLGSDSKGWSMYIDNKRSWFMHSGVHTARTDGGITEGSVVGVLVDLDRRMVSFYLDGEHHGPIAFTEPEAGLNTGGVFYPAVSVNRNVQLTLHSGLSPPIDSDSDDS